MKKTVFSFTDRGIQFSITTVMKTTYLPHVYACRSITTTVAAGPACPKLRRNGPREPGKTLMSKRQPSRPPWGPPPGPCRISPPAHNITTTRYSLSETRLSKKSPDSYAKARSTALGNCFPQFCRLFNISTYPVGGLLVFVFLY